MVDRTQSRRMGVAGVSFDLPRNVNPDDPTKNDVHPQLTAIVSQPQGQANITSSRVVLPWILRPNVPRIQPPGALCQDDQVARRACPPLSRVGTATAYSPLIPTPLSGLVQRIRAANSFSGIPDVPVTHFELTVDGSFTSHSGRSFDFRRKTVRRTATVKAPKRKRSRRRKR